MINIIQLKSYIQKLLHGQARTAKASKQVIYSFFLQGINILVGFLYVPLLLHTLTQEKYGIWLTLTSIIGWFSFFDIGLGNGLRNKLAEAFAKEDKVLGKKYVSTVYAILICIFSVILIIFHISNLFINWNSILNTKLILNRDLYLLTTIVFTLFFVRFIVQIMGVIYLADQKPAVNNSVNTFSNLLSFIIIFSLTRITTEVSLVLLGAIISFMPVLAFLLLSFYSFNKKYQFLKPAFSSIDFKMSRDLMNLGIKFFFLQITFIVIFSTSSVFIAQFFGPSEVVVYNVAFKYYQMPIMVFSIILLPIWSAVTDAYVKMDFDWLKITLKRLNYLSASYVLIILIMTLFSEKFFRMWVGTKVLIPFKLTLFMALYSIISISLAPYSAFINGTGKIKLTISLTLVGITLYFVSVFYFSKLFHNSTGVILAIIITSLIGAIVQPIQVYKLLNKKAYGIWNK